jgi:hypothetical protein
MDELTDSIQESLEHAKESKLNSKVAIMVALTATIMALCNIKGGNIVQAMGQAQSRGIDAWSYYQAKSTKQSLAENSLDLIKSQGLKNQQTADLIKQFGEKIKRYEKEKTDIKLEAQAYEKEYEQLNIFDDQFDMTEAFISIAIAMYGVTALTQKKGLFYFATCISMTGILFGIFAFLKIPLHPEWLASLLG